MNDKSLLFFLHPHVIKLCRLTHKIYSTDARWNKKSLNRYPYQTTQSPYWMTHFLNIDGLIPQKAILNFILNTLVLYEKDSESSLYHQIHESHTQLSDVVSANGVACLPDCHRPSFLANLLDFCAPGFDWINTPIYTTEISSLHSHSCNPHNLSSKHLIM